MTTPTTQGAMTYEKGFCETYSEWKNQFGDSQYGPCSHKAKYMVIARSGVNGKMNKTKVCGVHKRMIQNACKKIDKKLGDYSKFNSTSL